MVTKAIVEEILDDYTIRVRIPYFNKVDSAAFSTPFEDLPIAGISSMPNSIVNYAPGDIVIVAFDEGFADRPIILGQLSRVAKTNKNSSLTAQSLMVTTDVVLPEETYIGEVSPKDLKNLKGLNQNLQFQLEILSARVAKLEEQINKLNEA